jgi:hypothetical protein
MVTTSVTDDNIKRHCEDETLLKLPRSGLVQRSRRSDPRPYGQGCGANATPLQLAFSPARQAGSAYGRITHQMEGISRRGAIIVTVG